jgi:hypothetical protein
MKNTRYVIALMIPVALAGEQQVHASNLVTTFHVTVTVGNGSPIDVSIPTGDGKRIVLPADLDNWNCKVTPKFLSNDGTQAYHNVVCIDTNSQAVVGMSVACKLASVDGDANAFFMRLGQADVQFVASCMTRVQATAPAAPARQL